MTVPPAAAIATAAPDALPVALDSHRTAIWRYLRMLGASAAEADDLAQETMLVACTAPLADDPGAARAFLRGVAQNHWLRTRRWWQRRREREIAVAVEDLWRATSEHDAGGELLDRLRSCLLGLQPRAREALDLHYRDGMAWRDVAAQIGLTQNGTKTLVQRARQALRVCIERRTT